jgi:hypothetical protein
MDKLREFGECNCETTINYHYWKGMMKMDLYNNMEFELKGSFIPNISNSDKLKIVEITDGSVMIQMNNSKRRGVFPLDSFHYWIKRNSLIHINEHEKKTS